MNECSLWIQIIIPGQRGRIAKSDTHNLLERLKDNELTILLLSKKTDTAFTSNRAERCLPMRKIKQ